MSSNDEYAKFTAPGEVRLVRTLPGPIERVWEFLVDSDKRARWFAGGPMEPRTGGKIGSFFATKTSRRKKRHRTTTSNFTIREFRWKAWCCAGSRRAC